LRWPDFQNYRNDVTELYTSAGYQPVWSRNGVPTPTALTAIEELKSARSEGLDPEDYDGSRWDSRIAAMRKDAATANRLDLALTVSLMRYAADLRFGRANPDGRPAGGYRFGGAECDLATFILHGIALSDGPEAQAALLELDPPFAGYSRARTMLAQYLQLAQDDDGEKLPPSTKPIEPGQPYPGVPRLARLLRRLGDLPVTVSLPADSIIYQGPLVDAVKRFQARHGLDADGRLGAGTLAALNTPLDHRVRQLQLALERYRWIPRDSSKPRIVVNIPEFRLRAFDPSSGQPALEMKIVTGKAGRLQTPVFGADMKYVIFRPYWNVPPSIQHKELVASIPRDRSYLAKNEYEVVTPGGKVVETGDISDDVLAALRSGRLQVRQRPGAKNALGTVKFVLPNENDVYLHDTPARSLFARSRRDFSHGCVRVEKPLELAMWVLQDKPEWTRERIMDAMNGSTPVQVDLTNPIPVSIVYWTAVVPESGVAYFFDDIYGRDEQLDRELTIAGYGPRPRG
jgi:murein L,D-transpeptidase YcbB/YkuD